MANEQMANEQMGNEQMANEQMGTKQGPPCGCYADALLNATVVHNGHRVVRPRSCVCPRVHREHWAPKWSELATSRLPARTRMSWAFLQQQYDTPPPSALDDVA